MKAVTHHRGRRLTGVTFGKRGGPVYARIYDKTREADPDATIRDRWAAALGEPLPADARVWRIEFELRPEYLRTLAADEKHLPTDPRAVLVSHLDGIWRHLTSTWLVLRDPRSASRLSRCRTQPWWDAMSRTSGFTGSARPQSLTRLRRASVDPEPLLKQLGGVLAAFAARSGNADLETSLDAFCSYMRAADGEERFASAVERAALRLPLAARTREDAQRRSAEAYEAPMDVEGLTVGELWTGGGD